MVLAQMAIISEQIFESVHKQLGEKRTFMRAATPRVEDKLDGCSRCSNAINETIGRSSFHGMNDKETKNKRGT